MTLPVILAIALLIGHPQSPSTEKLEVIEQTSADMNPAADLADQVNASDLIVLATVRAREIKTRQPVQSAGEPAHSLANVPDVFTAYEVTVEDTLKVKPGSPDVTTVMQKAGDLQWGKYLIKANPGAAQLKVAGRYLLFLTWSDVLNAFLVSPNGAYLLQDGRVKPNGMSNVSRRQANRPADDLIAEVRRYRPSR